jgi:hypothetical protein
MHALVLVFLDYLSVLQCRRLKATHGESKLHIAVPIHKHHVKCQPPKAPCPIQPSLDHAAAGSKFPFRIKHAINEMTSVVMSML